MSKVITRSEHFVEIDEVEYEIRLNPDRGTDIEHRKLEDGRMVIGYLMHDEDCANPLEDCDGMGHIHSFSRRHRNNISPDEVSGMKYGEYAVPLSYFEHGLCKWGVAGSMSNMPDFCWDGVGYAGAWVPDKHCVEHIKSSAIAKMLPAGVVKVEYKSKYNPDGTCITRPPKPGETPYLANRMMVDERYSNVITLTITGGNVSDDPNAGPKVVYERGGYASFESAYKAAARWLGISINDKIKRIQAEKLVAMECAKSACEQYTSWCNGECYGVVVVTCNPDGSMIDSDECWGYIGHEYAEQTLKEQMEAVK